MKEKQIDLQKLTDKFFEDAKQFFGEGQERGLLVLSIDNEVGDGMVALTGGLQGKKSDLIIGLNKMMDKSDEFRELFYDTMNFRKFKKSPVEDIIGAIDHFLDEYKEGLDKRKAEKKVISEVEENEES